MRGARAGVKKCLNIRIGADLCELMACVFGKGVN